MIAGRLKIRLELFEPTQAADEFGRGLTTYTPRGVVWAERVMESSRTSVESGEIFVDITVKYNIRKEVPAADGWHVVDAYAGRFVVRGVSVNAARGMKTLRCERVNQ